MIADAPSGVAAIGHCAIEEACSLHIFSNSGTCDCAVLNHQYPGRAFAWTSSPLAPMRLRSAKDMVRLRAIASCHSAFRSTMTDQACDSPGALSPGQAKYHIGESPKWATAGACHVFTKQSVPPDRPDQQRCQNTTALATRYCQNCSARVYHLSGSSKAEHATSSAATTMASSPLTCIMAA